MSKEWESDTPLTIVINGQRITASMDAWSDVQKKIAKRQSADRDAWKQRQRDAGQVWESIIWRRGTPDVEEHFSLEDAKAACEGAEEWGTGSAVAIRLPYGILVDPCDLMELPRARAEEVEKGIAEALKWRRKGARA